MRFSDRSAFYNLGQARWVACVLNMAIAVVGRDSLLGLLLRQTRAEVLSLIEDEGKHKLRARAACFENN